MANLSKLKREKMLAFINGLKEQHKTDDKILIALGEIENEINSKKYGLVWEEHDENVDKALIDSIPVFTEVQEKELSLAEGEKYNFLLEGDNLHSLYLLEKTHKSKVGAIYIDPPYNTGKEDFIYNDKFVDVLDGYKNSKWLSFMSKRLRIAKDLLSNDGVIFISIDDNEYAPLKLLCDDIFGEQNCLSVHHIQVRYANKNLNEKKDFQEVCEYVLIYAKDTNKFEANKPSEDYSLDKFCFEIVELEPGEKTTIGGKKVEIFKKGQFEIIKHDEGNIKLLKATWASGSVVKGNASGKYFETYLKPRKDLDGLGTLYKVDGIGEDGIGYRYFTGPQKSSATQGLFYSGVPLDRLEEIKNGGSKKYRPIQNLYDFSPDFGNIRNEGGVPFNSGKKPIKMLKQLLNYHKSNDITVLDFFAGSGSTGHAVLDLNEEDGGTRNFILCTNNENNICEEVTYKRIYNVICGYNGRDGIAANLKYYKTDFISKDEEFLSDELLEHVKEMIQLEHSIKVDGKNYLLILDENQADEVEKNWSKYLDLKGIYISRNVLLTTSQNEKFSSVEVYIIPDYYFDFELKEVGETW
ncbi:MAG: site-specific DNA-methyltransferase [Acholeplasmataceae bacterium]